MKNLTYIESVDLRFLGNDTDRNNIVSILDRINYDPIYKNKFGKIVTLKRYGLTKFTDKIPEANGHVGTIKAIAIYQNKDYEAVLFKTDDHVINTWLHEDYLYCVIASATSEINCTKNLFSNSYKVKDLDIDFDVVINTYARFADGSFGYIN